jgi:uncharacterized membrane protein YdbT with pleckstrin-like domain
MSYVDSVLQPGEVVRHRSRLHWIVYWRGLWLCGVALIVYLVFRDWSGFRFAADVASLLCLAAGLFYLAQAWFEQWTTEIAVTNRRVIYKEGFIRRRTIEVHMDKVASVDVDQSIFGRILDYGDVFVHSTGVEFEPLETIAAPLELRNHITAV